MDLALLPLLQVQRDLYRLPRGMDRFREYVATMTGGTSDVVLPLVAMNPMAKDHVPALLDRYLALDAEATARAAVDEARRRLARVTGSFRVALVVSDDLMGGWTDRAQAEHAHRFARAAEVKRGFATAILWTSEPASVEPIRARVLATIHRSAQTAKLGTPRTLGEILRYEGRAARFAGRPDLPVDEDARSILDRHRDSSHFGTIFACLWGDREAERSGHAPLGVPAGAAFAIALDECDEDPVSALEA